MQKEFAAPTPELVAASNGSWMDFETARVRLTSEDPAWPIESALKEDVSGKGWKAAHAGAQTIWVGFPAPQPIQEIKLRFEASERRTQEFALQYSTDGGRSYREIVRQQFNFSPDAAIRQDETYRPNLVGVTDLKLTIIPDISGGDARALRIR